MKKNVFIALFGLVLAACGDKTASSSTGEATAAKSSDNILHIYNWSNALSVDTVARFEASCSCKVVQDFYGDNEELLAKLTIGAKGYDMVFRAPLLLMRWLNKVNYRRLIKKW